MSEKINKIRVRISNHDLQHKHCVFVGNYKELVQKTKEKLGISQFKFVRQRDLASFDEDYIDHYIKSHTDSNEELELIALKDKEEAYIIDGKDNLEYLPLIKLLEKSQEVDLCFCIDCTSSIGSKNTVSQEECITTIKDLIEGILEFMKIKFKYLKIRLGFVGYRDICDGEKQFEILDFTDNVKEFKHKIKSLKAEGGGDECEDVLGGLLKVTKLAWKHSNRIMIHIADAPAHGKRFYVEDLEDEHPDGIQGLDAEDILKKLCKDQEVSYFFIKTTKYTNKMIDEFNKELEKLSCKPILTSKLTSVDKLLNILQSTLTMTITDTTKKLQTDGHYEVRKKKNLPIDKRCLHWNTREMRNFKALCSSFKFTGKIKDFKKLKQTWNKNQKNTEGINRFITVKEEKVNVYISSVPFAVGNCRYAYAAMFDNGKELVKCVAKNSLYEDDPTELYSNKKSEIAIQLVSKYLSRKFPSPGTFALKFLDVKLIYIKETNQYYTIEKYLDSSWYIKWSNQLNENEDIFSRTLGAFSHWSYVITDNYLMICDLQGVKNDEAYILTDPAINSVERLFGRTDIGELGITEYFKNHQCNELCRALELPKPSFQKLDDRVEDEIQIQRFKPTPVRPDFNLNRELQESSEAEESSEDELIVKKFNDMSLNP